MWIILAMFISLFKDKVKPKAVHRKGECDIVEKVCRTCGTDFSKTGPGLVQLRRGP